MHLMLINLNIVGQKQPVVEEKPVVGEEAQWSFKKNVATYGTTTEILVTVSGVKSTEGLSLEGTTVVIDKHSLSNKTIKISSGYTLKLADSVATPKTSTTWKFSGSTATLKKSATSGYILSEDSRTITYKKSSKPVTEITLTGLKKGLKVIDGEIEGIYADTDSKVVTLSAEVLGTSNVKVKGNYTLELEGDVPEPTESTFELYVSSTKLNVKPASAAGYVLATNQKSVSYKKAVLGKVTASVSGLKKGTKSTDGVNVFDNSISISGEILSNKSSVSGGNYEFYFEENYNNAAIAGSKSEDSITVAGSNLTITGGKGNDYLSNDGSANTFVYSNGDGDDVIANFTEEDKIKISKVTVKSVKTENSDVVITVGKGTITLEDAAGQDISINNKIYQTAEPEFSNARKSESEYLFPEDNFDDIIEFDSIQNGAENFSGQFEDTKNFDKLTPENLILTATDNK